jgi:hypothetical protein
MFVKSGQPAISPFHRFLSSFFFTKIGDQSVKADWLGTTLWVEKN